MVFARRIGILCCLALSALSIATCIDSSGNITPLGRAILGEPADYFYYDGLPVAPSDPYFATRLHLQNIFDEAITARIDLDAINFPRYEFGGLDALTVDDGGGTGSVLVDIGTAGEVQVPLFINEGFTTPSWVVNFPVDIFRQGEQDTGTPIGSDTISVTGFLRPLSALDDARLIAFDIGGPTLETTLINNVYGYSRVPRLPSPPDLPAVLAEDEFQLVGGIQLSGTTGGYRGASRDLPAFPCGPIPGGLVVCPEFPASPSAGPFLYIFMVVDDVIPLSDPVNFIQYGAVFDADGNTANNFEADPAFPNDFFQGTDLWYFLSYDPTNGWTLNTVDASGPGNPTSFFSDASAIILGNTIVWVIPYDEFPGASIANAGYRITAFGNNGPFSALDQYQVDYEPGLDEPLFPAQPPTR